MDRTIEPLEAGIWLHQIGVLAGQPVVDQAALTKSLRKGYFLTKLAPRPLQHLVGTSVSESEFEHLLETEAVLPAALALLGDGLKYTFTHLDRDGRFKAEVWFSHNCCTNGSASEPSAPGAIFKAWLDCLGGLDERRCVGEAPPSLPDRRKCQSSRRPRLTEH